MYKHHVPSSTSLSDDYDDDDAANLSTFFLGTDTQPRRLAPVPANWSSKQRSSRAPAYSPPRFSPMSQLPTEIIIHVFRNLHSSRDLYNCLRVSRTWCECAIELLWHKPSFPKYGTLEKMGRLLSKHHQTFTYARFVRRLNFLTLSSDLQDDIFSLFSHCDRLERLTLVNCKHISGNILARVLPSFPNLVAIDLTGVVETNDEAIIGLAQSATRLQGINLAGCSKVTDAGVVTLANNCPLLRRVKLSNLDLLTDEPISALARSCPLLLEIDLNHCELVTHASIRDIWIYSAHMREMRLSYCSKLTDAAFPAPPRPDVSSDITNPFPIDPNSNMVPPLITLRSFELLRMLDLTACSLLTDDAIEGIISHAPKIRNLVLSKCSLLTDKSVMSICRLGRHLHYLHLGHANKITDNSVRALARSCTRIRYVDFANCTLLTDMSVFELSALPKLRRIGLVRVSNLTDEAIYSLAERHATLERIHLSYCDQISVMAIHFLLLKLHKLTHLSLTGVPAFRVPELQRYCREAPRDFNTAQRMAFCVYSGKGVSQLRAYLTELFDRITEVEGTDDTEYEEDVFDGEGYQEEDTPEAEVEMGGEGEVGEGQEEAIRQAMANVTVRENRVPNSPYIHRPQPQPFIVQREHAPRTTAMPPQMASPGILVLQGAVSRLNAQVQAQGTRQNISTQIAAPPPVSGPFRRPRVASGLRTMADMLPIIESSNSPPPSDAASNRSIGSSNSNGTGFFRTYREGEPGNGTLTPDLNYAEIGHGRGAQGVIGQHPMARSANTQHVPATGSGHLMLPTIQPRIQSNFAPSSPPFIHQAECVSASWPYREPTSPAGPSTAPTPEPAYGVDGRGRTELRESAQVATGLEGRGRSVKRSIRNTLNAAEQYASNLLFRRSSVDVRDDNGMSAAGRSSAHAH